MKYFLIGIVCLFLGLSNEPDDKMICSKSLTKHVDYLASEKLQGRLSGSEGYNAAAEYCADIFKENNLKEYHKDYFQLLNVEYNDISKAEMQIIVDGEVSNLELGKDFICRGFTGSGNIKGEVVFCGYGISQPELGYDDFANMDVKDKIVMVFKYNPKWNINNQGFEGGYPRFKSKVAFDHGAKGIIFISFPNDAEPQIPIGSVLHGPGEQNVNFPQVHISLDAADKLFKDKEITLKLLQKEIDETKKPHSLRLRNEAVINIKADYEKEKETMNIVGFLEGTDANLKNEYIVIGAHLDHVGRQADIYFPGANDNASGSAALLEIIEAINKNNVITKRSIIFVLFASEEQGLFGSEFFVKNSPVPLNKIAAMINLDCIGFGDSLQLGGGKSAPVLWELAKKNDKENNLNITINDTWKGGGADAAPFYNEGIPTLYFATKNSYKHLHMLSDKTETLNKELLEKVTKLAYYTVIDAANDYVKEGLVK